jgi:dolichol-phosphate mannosyltransferase
LSRDTRTLSAVLPVFAEEETVPELVGRLHELVGDRLLEVLVVTSPRSPDRTLEVCREVASRFPRVRTMEQTRSPGVGFAFRDGIEAAAGDLILLMDSDGEMDVEDVPRLLARLESTGADMVVGSRWAKGGGAVGYDPLKLVLNRGYQLLFRALYTTRIHDLTFGFKLARAPLLKSLSLNAQFQEIGCEVTLKALRARWRVEEIPTVWRARKAGVSTNPLSRNLEYARLAWDIWRA